MAQRESIADSDPEDGKLREMLASLLYMQSRGNCKSSGMPTAPGKPAALSQERVVRAERTQADLRKDLCQVRLRNREHGKFAAMFSLGGEEPGNQFKSSLFKHADPLKLGRSLPEGTKDQMLSQAGSHPMKQEQLVGSPNNCIGELQQQSYAQRLELQDAQHGHVESRREQVRPQEELSLKETVLPDTQIRSMHQMGKMKRAQELRVDKFSVAESERKSRDSADAHFPIAAIARTDEFYE